MGIWQQQRRRHLSMAAWFALDQRHIHMHAIMRSIRISTRCTMDQGPNINWPSRFTVPTDSQIETARLVCLDAHHLFLSLSLFFSLLENSPLFSLSRPASYMSHQV
uniref:Uncharacterized protein n=1 Tax=Setaria viridis TaxID=4556 RepID=A0A4U6VP64_SETVI|nr:hypothetical protein SEVIR_3G401400v2 [Setaria viridis]